MSGWDFRISDLVKNPDGTDFNPCCEFRWSPEGPVSQIYSPLLHAGAPGIFSDLLRFVHMLKKAWDAESNGKLPHLFIPNKTVTRVCNGRPAFAQNFNLPAHLSRHVILCSTGDLSAMTYPFFVLVIRRCVYLHFACKSSLLLLLTHGWVSEKRV